MAIGASRDAFLTEIILALRDQLSSEGKEAARTLDRLDQESDELTRSFDRANRSSTTFGASLRTLGINALALNEIRHLLYALISPIQRIGEASDSWNQMTARVNLFSGSAAEGERAMKRLIEISLSSRTPLEATAQLYARLAQGMSEQGVSQEELTGMVQALSDALLINGSSAAEAQGAIMQFSQAMASGTLRGEEFNSVAEQAPLLLDAMAAELGVSKGALRAMAAEGELTTDVLRRSMAAMAGTWRAQAEEIPLTIGQAMTNLYTQFVEYIGQSESAQKATTAFASGVTALGENLEGIGDFMRSAGFVAITAALLSGAKAATVKTAAMLAASKAEAAAAATAQRAAESRVMSDRLVILQAQHRANVTAVVLKREQELLAFTKMLPATQAQLEAAERRVTAAKLAHASATKALSAAQGTYAASTAAATAATTAAAASGTLLAQTFEKINAYRAANALTWGQLLSFSNALSAGFSVLIGYEIGKWMQGIIKETKLGAAAYEGLDLALGLVNESYRKQTEAEKSLAEKRAKSNEILKKISETTGVVVRSMADLESAIKAGVIVQNASTGAYEKGIDTTSRLAQGLGNLDSAYVRAIESIGEHNKEAEKGRKAAELAAKAAADTAKALGNESEALILAADAQELKQRNAEDALRGERALLATMETRLQQLAEEKVATDSARNARNAIIKTVTDEIIAQRDAVAAAELRASSAEREAIKARELALAYHDQSSSIDSLNERRRSLVERLGELAVESGKAAAEQERLNDLQRQAADAAAEREKLEASSLASLGVYKEKIQELADEERRLAGEIEASSARITESNKAAADAERVRKQLESVTRLIADAHADAADNLAKEIAERDRALKLADKEAKIRLDAIKASEELAKARGDEAEAARLAIRAAAEEIDSIRRAAQAKRDDAESLRLQADERQRAASIASEYTEKERESVEAIRQSAEMAELEAKALDASADSRAAGVVQMEREEAARQILNDGIEETIDALERETEAREAAAKRDEAAITVAIASARARGDVAAAMELEAQRLRIQQERLRESVAEEERLIAELEKRAESTRKAEEALGGSNKELAEEARRIRESIAAARERIADTKAAIALKRDEVAELEREREARKVLNDGIQESIAKLREEAEARASAAERSVQLLEIAEKRAKALGDEKAANEAATAALKVKLQAQEDALRVLEEEQALQAKHLENQERAAEIEGETAEKKRETTAATREAVIAAREESAATRVQIELTKAEIEARELERREIDAGLPALKRAIEASKEAAKASDAMTDAARAEAKARGDLAKAVGDEAGAARAALAIKELELEAQRETIAGMERELEKQREYLAGLESLGAAKAKETEEQLALIRSLELGVKARRASAESMEIEVAVADASLRALTAEKATVAELVAQRERLTAELRAYSGAAGDAGARALELTYAEADLAEAKRLYTEAVEAGKTGLDGYRVVVEQAEARVKGLTSATGEGALTEAEAAEKRRELTLVTIQLAAAAREAADAITLQIQELNRELELERQEIEISEARIQGKIEMAQRTGDLSAEEALRVDLLRKEIEQLKASEDAARERAVRLREQAELLRIAAEANGEYTEKERAQVEAVLDAARASELSAEKLDIMVASKRKAAHHAAELADKARVMREELAKAGVDGVDSISGIESAITSANESGEIEALGDAIEAAFRRGAISAEEYKRLLEEIEKRQAAIKNQIRKVEVDYETLFKQYGADLNAFAQAQKGLNPEGAKAATDAYEEWLREQGFFGGPRQKSWNDLTAAEVAERMNAGNSRQGDQYAPPTATPRPLTLSVVNGPNGATARPATERDAAFLDSLERDRYINGLG